MKIITSRILQRIEAADWKSTPIRTIAQAKAFFAKCGIKGRVTAARKGSYTDGTTVITFIFSWYGNHYNDERVVIGLLQRALGRPVYNGGIEISYMVWLVPSVFHLETYQGSTDIELEAFQTVAPGHKFSSH